jgi:histidyl-tRNA synthetase
MTLMDDSMRSRGMRDLLPDEMDRVRKVEDAFAAACRLWGYREIRTPVIEPLHLFTAAGTLSPKMLDTVYSFLDWDGWSGERVVRPDSTIPVARLYVEKLKLKMVRSFMFRAFFALPRGRSREDWQCGVELIGDSYRSATLS